MPNDNHYTYNELTNADKDLLLRHGYIPGELPAEEERELIADLREQGGGGDDEDGDRLSTDIPAAERD